LQNFPKMCHITINLETAVGDDKVMTSQIHYEVLQSAHTVVVTFDGDTFDASNIKQFRQDVHDLYQNGKRNFIFDFAKINFIDSSAIGGLLYILKAVGNEGTVALCHVNTNVRYILTIVNLIKLIPIYDNLEDALEVVDI